MLARNWQRLILTHLEEKEHPGVLTGSPITDIQITLLTGRAHTKHTRGRRFSARRLTAPVRQGLRKAKSILLEPYYTSSGWSFPERCWGEPWRISRKMQGSFQPPETDGETAVLTGTAPVAEMRDYQKEINSYTRGKGTSFL